MEIEADVMMNPSLVDNMPVSILESLASGVPVVSTNVGGIPDLVEANRTAVLVPSQAPEEMADAVIQLLEHPEVRARMRAEGIGQAREWGWERVGGQWLDLYRGNEQDLVLG